MHPALAMSLSRALSAVADHAFDAATLTSGQRVALERRRQDLARSLAPCGRTRTAAILATLGGMASSRSEVDPEMAVGLVRQDIEDLERFPEWALAAAAQAHRTGVIGGGKWRPTAGELAKEARRLAGELAQEHAQIARVLDAPTPAPLVAEEDRAAVMKRIRAAYPEIFEEQKPAFPDAEARLAALAEESQRKPLKLSDAARKLFSGQ
jgi:hypothetical protein